MYRRRRPLSSTERPLRDIYSPYSYAIGGSASEDEHYPTENPKSTTLEIETGGILRSGWCLITSLQLSPYVPTMVSIRRARVEDLLEMQNTNLWCLPENYQLKCEEYCVSCRLTLTVSLSRESRAVDD